MDKALHITNGNSFISVLEKLQIKGEIITWHEMLCEGKTIANVGSELFWKTRYDFFKKAYSTTKNRFIDSTLKEYRRLCNQKTQNEIVLWFDHDLSSQINMIAVVSWLKKHKKHVQISVVSDDKPYEPGNWYKLSDLPEEALLELYNSRIHLNRDDVEYADYIWQLYCSKSPLRLATFSKFNSSRFQYLPDAIEAHIHRFPTVKNGLNKIENNLLRTVAEQEPPSREALVEQMLETEKIYGFTAIQYNKIIKSLKSLFRSSGTLALNKTGEALLSNSRNYYSVMKNDNAYFGGSRKYSFLYHNDSGKLLKL